MNKIKILYFKLKTKLYYKKLFKEIGERSLLYNCLKIDGAKNIVIKKNVLVNQYTWLYASNLDNKEKLIIDEGTQIGHFNHIVSLNKIYIGKNVLIADKVYISDNYHDYQDVNIPIINQKILSKNETYIGEGTWIGENCVIVSCNIGKNCVIGANSFVNKDIPDYCVAVGNPAKIVKKYNIEQKIWERI